jgi:hypothetical protein
VMSDMLEELIKFQSLKVIERFKALHT